MFISYINKQSIYTILISLYLLMIHVSKFYKVFILKQSIILDIIYIYIYIYIYILMLYFCVQYLHCLIIVNVC